MKLKYLVTIVASSIITLGMVGISNNFDGANASPCAAAGKNPCASANPCSGAAEPSAGTNPCAAESKNPGTGEANPCAAAAQSAPLVYVESSSGLAIRGTDPVAYFTEEKAVPGVSEYETEWQGAVWRFSSAKNQDMFEANPEEYAPQYGGYCAKALSEGKVVSSDPEAWTIVNGKLYLNYNKDVQKQWLKDVDENISLADKMWPEVLEGATVSE